MTKEEVAVHAVDLHEKGLLCGAEVFNKYLDLISEENLEKLTLALSSQLVGRFHRSIDEFLENPAAYFPFEVHRQRLSKMRLRAELMRSWLRHGTLPSGTKTAGA